MKSPLARAASLGGVAGSFLLGQGFTQVLAVLVGLLLVRILTVEQYALFTLAGSLSVIVSLGSNFGLGQAMVSLGAKTRDDTKNLGALWQSSRQLSGYLFPLTCIVIFLLVPLVFRAGSWQALEIATCVFLVLAIGYLQIDTALYRAVLNIHRVGRSLFRIALAEVMPRLILVLGCLLWPSAIVALAGTLCGAAVARYLARREAQHLIDPESVATRALRQALGAFVIPIVPPVLYSLVQGQLAILILSWQGSTEAIAEVGALARLAQVFAMLSMLNPFLIQPMFARISTHHQFARRLTVLLVTLTCFSAVAVTSAYAIPQLWLFVLGGHYQGLAQELPLAIGSAVAAVVGGALYSVAIARGDTSLQTLAILPSLAGQVLWIFGHGLGAPWSVTDALMLGLLSTVPYAFGQWVLACLVVRRMRMPPPPAGPSRV